MAALLEMPADSKEFLLVEKGLLKVEGLVDDSWDEKDPVQSGYLFAKLKRFNLDLVKATFSTVESSRELAETVTAFKQSAKGSTAIGSGTSLLGATSAVTVPKSTSGEAAAQPEPSAADQVFTQFQSVTSVLSTQKGTLEYICTRRSLASFFV